MKVKDELWVVVLHALCVPFLMQRVMLNNHSLTDSERQR